MISEHRKLVRVCARYRRMLKKRGENPPTKPDGMDLWDYAFILITCLAADSD